MASQDVRTGVSGYASAERSDRVMFFDPTGRRWRVVRMALLVAAALAVTCLAVVVPQVSQPTALEPGVSYPAITADEVGTAPLFGTGPLLRVVRLERHGGHLMAMDPFADAPLHVVGAADGARLGKSTYAIERYGYEPSRTHTMSLTFDDGPDPIYTPKILDLLSRERVPATFCIMGRNAAKYPHIVERIVREGHALCNHSYSHADLSTVSAFQAREEMILTDRILRVTGGVRVDYLRPPYNGADDKSVQESTEALLRTQQWGYQVANYDFDTADWEHALDRKAIPMPDLSGGNLTVLLHDAGGKRENSIAYTKKLIDSARARGYTFHTMPDVNPELAAATSKVTPTAWDKLTFGGAVVISAWSGQLLRYLLYLAVFLVVTVGLVNVCLAILRRVTRRRRVRSYAPHFDAPLVSVVIAAFNEEKVIERTLDTVRRTKYPYLDIVVVDDGSTDRTAEIVDRIRATDDRVRLVRQANTGKATALNNGFEAAAGEIVVTGDADTIFMPDAITNLVRHFVQPGAERLAAVAGVIKVGNVRNLLTRWQALEYLTQVGVERAAHAAMGAIMTVPGACAAWRRSAVLAVGGFSHATLAEDCDLALTLQQRGYLVTQDDEAIAYTEVPETMAALLRQRLRWTFGNLQSLWKHRGMLLRPRFGCLGLVVLPFAALSLATSVAFMPFIYLMVFLALRDQGVSTVLFYLLVFLGIHLVFATIGVILQKERASHLLILPLYPAIQEPLRAYLVFKSLVSALRGARLGWNKLGRTGTIAPDPVRPVRVAPVVAAPVTVAKRERWLDFLRSIALVRIVTYHTLGIAWLSLVFPSMGIMFGLAGSLMARSLDRSSGGVIMSRLRRLLPALWLLAVIWVPVMIWHGWTSNGDAARALNGPELLLWVFPILDPPSSDWGGDVSQVLWYLRTYLWFVLLSPLALAAFRRWPVRTMLVPLGMIALSAIGVFTFEDSLLNSALLDVATYGACWLLGFAHHDGMIKRARRSTLALLAVPTLAIGGWWAWSQYGVLGTYDLNEIPFAQAMWSFGFVLLLLRFSPTMGWLERIPILRRLVEILNSRAVTVYLWHEVAILLSVGAVIFVAIDNVAVQLAIVWALVAVAVVLFGWVEDLAARRTPQLVPGVPIPIPALVRLAQTPVRGFAWIATPRRALPALASLGVAAAAILLVTTVISPARLGGGATVSQAAPTAGPTEAQVNERAASFRVAAVQWIERNVASGSRVIAGESMMRRLVSAGFPTTYLVPFDLVDSVVDAADDKQLTPAALAETSLDYVVETTFTRGSPKPSPATRQRLGQAPTIATFGTGDERVEIRLVLPKLSVPTDDDAAADAAARRHAGTELATNDRLQLTPAARTALESGQVDSRLLSVLSLLTGEHRLGIAGFALEPGESRTSPRRNLRITSIDGRPVTSSADVARLSRVLNLQRSTFRPTEFGVVGDPGSPAFEVHFAAPSPVGLLPGG